MRDNAAGEITLEPLESKTVVQLIIERITNAIAAGNYKRGQKLPSEFVLMEELNVSRNSLREAMKILSATGIVNIRRGDGTYVAAQLEPSFLDNVLYGLLFESSSDDEIVELRQTLDEAVLRLAMKKVKEEDVNHLQESTDRMKASFDHGDLERASKEDYQFHLFLTDCSGNAFLSRIVKGVYQLFQASIAKNIRVEDFFANADVHHQDIVNCLRSKKEEDISKVISQSLDTWRKNVKKQK